MLYESPVPHQRTDGSVLVRTDVYPANVSFSFASNPYPRARAILTVDKVLILVDGLGGAAVLYEERLENVSIGQTSVVATTVDGDVEISRQGGCGCGSTLRGYRPFGRAMAMAAS
jgi:hypothetical protein